MSSDRDFVRIIPSEDPRLGRHVRHDPMSKQFVRPHAIDKSTWHDKKIRIYDPRPNPDQTIGNCTAVSKCVQFNAAGDRHTGVVLDMDDAVDLYKLETQIDQFQGVYPPDDTGSNGLAACKAAQQKWQAGAYYWLFQGADDCIQSIMDGDVVSVGTYWMEGMFDQDSTGRVHPTGDVAGGHQYSLRGYWKDKDWVLGRCWWGDFRDFWISRDDLDGLLRNDGDAHVQERA